MSNPFCHCKREIMKLIFVSLLVVVVVVVAVSANKPSPKKVNQGKIMFKISGRNLPDVDRWMWTTDGYVEVFLSENFGKKTKLVTTNTVDDNENPNWSTLIEFDFDRFKNQQLHFIVWDKERTTDDKVGTGSIKAADLVDKSQAAVKVPLDTQGYLLLRKLDTHG